MTEIIERLEELITHYRKVGLVGEVIGLRVALDIIKGVVRCGGNQTR